jgi:hypothetical protein
MSAAAINPPKGECVWVGYYKDEAMKYMMTSKENNRDFYFLYEVANGSLKKLGKARSPLELEIKFEINTKLCS